MRINKDDEYQEQCIYAEWFSYAYPKKMMSIFCGGLKLHGVGQGKKMKKAGYRKGSPDITIMSANKYYHGLYIEMKKKSGGLLSQAQKEVMDYLNAEGYLCVCCNGFEEAKKITEKYLKNK